MTATADGPWDPGVSEPSYLAAVRESYDTVADAYAEQVPRPADLDPLDRALLGMFAETVREAGLGPLADLGCGPGFVTAHLAGLGAPVFGVDLSPRMVELARRAHPDLAFAVGSMTALGIGTGTLGGILAHCPRRAGAGEAQRAHVRDVAGTKTRERSSRIGELRSHK